MRYQYGKGCRSQWGKIVKGWVAMPVLSRRCVQILLLTLVLGAGRLGVINGADSKPSAPQRGISIYSCLWEDWKDDGVFNPPKEIREVKYNFSSQERIALVIESTLKHPISLDYAVCCGTNSIEKGSISIPGSESGDKAYAGLGFPSKRFEGAASPLVATWYMAGSSNLIGITTFTVSDKPGK